MMPLKEYIEIKPTINVKRKRNRVARLMLGTLAVSINSVLPFVCGFYFMKTGNILFIAPLVFLVFFRMGIAYDS